MILGEIMKVGMECWDGGRNDGRIPSGYVKIAIENGPVEIVDCSMNSMVDLSSSLCYIVYQRVIFPGKKPAVSRPGHHLVVSACQ